ncbi:gas vesicle protein [Actinomadura sp. DLS-62]|uniref:Gas vesicle protein n=2 Tax=Actinomadura monticuli TaxID=3097367 RepID=A0ABV4QNT3_9ACTN
MAGERSSANLADLLERILDKGIVIVGDIRVNLLDIELLTIKLRLLVASVDRAKEMGIDWWEHDPSLSSKARQDETARAQDADRELLEENRRLRERLAALEAGPPDAGTNAGTGGAGRPEQRKERRS